MEPRFGHDFSQVRVHTDSAAAESARALNAAAYTVGRDMVFGANRYAPDTSSGRELLGHELAHTIQQRDASGPPPPANGPLETSAAAAGRAVASGQAVAAPLPAGGIGISRAPLNDTAITTADEVLSEGKVWREQKYSNALLTETNARNRADKLTYSRALTDVDIEMSKAQQARQEFAPILDDVTESRIGYRRNALLEIVRTKSVKEGLSSAKDRAGNAEELSQIALVGQDVKLVQDEFRSRAFNNAYRLLDEGSREIGQVLRSYGVQIARAEGVIRFVRVYEGEAENEAAKWVETSRVANTSGYSDIGKAQHRTGLSTSLTRLRALQSEVKRLKPTMGKVVEATSFAIGPIASVLPRVPDSPELKRAKAALAGAWLNAERDHPVLAAYRAGKQDALEDIALGRGGETEDLQALVSQAIRVLANILTAKLALKQGKVSPYELAPIVALTRAQMLIRRGSVWDIAIENLMRGDDDGAEWAKEALLSALGALMLVFPLAWPLMVASAAVNLHAAGKAYARYGLDTALIGTNLDRAKAISSKTPSLAGFAWALVGAGLDIVGIRAALGQAQTLRAKVLAGDEAAVGELNKLGENFNVAQLGDDVARTKPVRMGSRPKPTARPTRAAAQEDGIVGSTPRRKTSFDRGRTRPFYHKDPGRVAKRPGLDTGTPKRLGTATGRVPKPLPETGQELVARAEAMLERLPANHAARDELSRFIERSKQRLAPIRTLADARGALDELTERLNAIEQRYRRALSPRAAPPPRPNVGATRTPVHDPADRVQFGALDESGRATHVTGEARPTDLRTGTETADFYPPGAVRGELNNLHARRGHLLANLFGGSGTRPGNLMWLNEFVNNSPYKTEFEHLIARALDQGHSVRFTIVPHFRSPRSAAPYAVEVWAETTAGSIVVSHRSIPTPGLRDLEIPSVAR